MQKISLSEYYCIPGDRQRRLAELLQRPSARKGTRAEDALTVVGVDTYNRRLKLVRIGSNITMDMTERKYHVVEY